MKIASGITMAGILCLVFVLSGLAQAAKAAVKTADKAKIAHGQYLVKGVAQCGDCHTPRNIKGEPVPGEWLKGGKLHFGPPVSSATFADVAPDIAGLPGWKTEDAIHLLMTGLDSSGHRLRPPMPQFRMTRTDATAVVAYLKSLKYQRS